MPIVTEETLDAYGYCQALLPVPGSRRRVRCAGYEPTPARVMLTHTQFQYGDGTGWQRMDGEEDPQKVERSTTHLRFTRDEDRLCQHCGQWTRAPMLDDHHPVYDNLSLRDPDELLNIDQARIEAAQRQADGQADVANALREMGAGLQALVLAQREEIALLREQVTAMNGNGGDTAEPEPKPAARKR